MRHLADCPSVIAVLATTTSCPGGMEAAEGGRGHPGSCGGSAIPGTLSRVLRPFPTPPLSLRRSSRSGAGRGLPWEGGSKGSPLLAALLSLHRQLVEERGCALFLRCSSLALMILSFVVTLDKDEDGAGTPFVPSVVPNTWWRGR